MTHAELIERLRDCAEQATKVRDRMERCDNRMGMEIFSLSFSEAADALETAARKDVERVHEINKLKLAMQRMERRK